MSRRAITVSMAWWLLIAVSVTFADIPKANAADVPKMRENLKSKLAGAGVLMQMPGVILEKLDVKRG